jgi:YidC/Oxa1 family membrane protein insertase
MERGNLGRLAFIAVGLFIAFVIVPKWFHGSSSIQPLRPEQLVVAATARPAESFCDIWTDDFHAKLSSRSATLMHFELLHAKYRKKGVPIDLSTTPDVEDRRSLRFDWQNPALGIPSEDWLVAGNLLDYSVEQSSKTSCDFTYEDARARVTETVRATGRPYELEVTATVTNRSTRPLRQALTVDDDAWRTDKEQKSGLMGQSALVTHVECVSDTGAATRKRVEDFDADKFKDFPATPLAAGDWFQPPGKPAFGAVSNSYFSQAIVPLAGPTDPACQLQVEERWNASRYRNRKDDPEGGAMFRARLAYAPHEVAAGASETYRVLSYMGPKERSILEAVGGGGHRLIELIDLGFFSAIAKILVAFLLKVHSVVPNWGLAIIVLTITARTLLFPLTLPSVKQMIRMRELKPEMDILNEKFKDDAQAKGLAQMELWRKHSVNPLKGCLPQMASMPVWFALYTTLQTAVELYNIPFLWFPDLSGPDPLFILPFVIGATNFMQQKLMPMQGDPAQQKMMLYLMPGMFIVMMLFLPSGLGVYMFTNGLLGIAQQQLVERHARRAVAQGKKA